MVKTGHHEKARNAFHLLVLVLSVLSSSVRAGTLGDLTYKITDGEVRITDCDEAAEGELVIPNEIEGLPVTSIEGGTFNGCWRLTSVTIAEGVTSIGSSAFLKCSSLTSIIIPDGVTSIGGYAFWGCSSLTSITIPQGVTSIGQMLFRGCSSLTSITIPDSVTSIRNNAFYECKSLKSITIPDSVTSIEGSAFRDCYSLTSITIPEGITSIMGMTFNSCVSLTSITIPEGVTSIGRDAFGFCTNLNSITIPDSVTSIGDVAFNGCSSLAEITIPQAFHNEAEANRLSVGHLWPDGFFLPGLGAAYSSAKATAVLTNGFVVGAEITDGGANYGEIPVVTITGGGGTGAEAVAVLTDGRVTSIEMINAGRGYTSEPTITIEPPIVPPTQVSLRMVPAITITGDVRYPKTIEVADTPDGPWTEWRTVVIGEEGTTEVDLDEGAEKRFYRVRD